MIDAMLSIGGPHVHRKPASKSAGKTNDNKCETASAKQADNKAVDNSGATPQKSEVPTEKNYNDIMNMQKAPPPGSFINQVG